MTWYNGGWPGYWRKNTYRRLEGEDGPRRRVRRSKVDLGGVRRRRFWRIKVPPRLRFLRVISPRRLLSRIRDAYVSMMLAFANSGALASYGVDGFSGFHVPPVKEYDERMILEIYKSIISQGQLITTKGIGGVPACELAVRR